MSLEVTDSEDENGRRNISLWGTIYMFRDDSDDNSITRIFLKNSAILGPQDCGVVVKEHTEYHYFDVINCTEGFAIRMSKIVTAALINYYNIEYIALRVSRNRLHEANDVLT